MKSIISKNCISAVGLMFTVNQWFRSKRTCMDCSSARSLLLSMCTNFKSLIPMILFSSFWLFDSLIIENDNVRFRLIRGITPLFSMWFHRYIVDSEDSDELEDGDNDENSGDSEANDDD